MLHRKKYAELAPATGLALLVKRRSFFVIYCQLHTTKQKSCLIQPGDEGLTQAISALRKVLKDDTKQLIQTVPKKGYLLAAVNLDPPPQKIANRSVTGKTAMISVIAAIVLVVIVSLIFVSKKNNKSNQELSTRKEQ